jgi:hypothetical protein
MSKVEQAIDFNLELQPWSDPHWAGDIPIGAGIAIPVIRSCRSSNWTECPLRIWEMPNLGWYTIAVDPSSGKDHDDPAAIQVVDSVGSQVAEMLLISADMESQFKAAEWLGYFYNEAKMVVEVNSFGIVLARMFDEFNYPNIYFDQRGGIGQTTTVANRSMMIGTMQRALLDNRQILRSKRLKRELLSFVEGGSAQDDLTTAMMIAYQCK